ncbi:uncharacterized protein LOC115097112 isoform X1 [Rhinatrema bivittatum]|uniref:uncharacterized protein LOC115097112 isoform X1 n=1 Tax=Rhinatrema bivittatum TaxID=194408 RepID=UPI001129EFBA|nr:uncharacterized protein LOC115097112 isoform X1 [Rhinatrema bivittatum]XP_029468493.1 uncharacterized protein LOC115097112 isoform X1 [Rhinatrema bivittatum]
MYCSKRQAYLATISLTICISTWILYEYIKTYSRIQRKYLPVMIKQQNHHCNEVSASGVITPLPDRRTFIVAPYFDARENIIRVIAIIHYQEVKELYCWFCCGSNSSTHRVMAIIDLHADRFGFPYGTADLLCSKPKNCDAKYVSIHLFPEGNIEQLPAFKINNREPVPRSAEFTVCISTMFGNYNNVLQFIQSIEMYKLLGAQKVIIYKHSCSQLIEEILQYYILEGTVEVIPWPITDYLTVSGKWKYSMDAKDIGYYGQITTLNDCVYRNMYTSKYVILNDLDEIILPFKHGNWTSMMNSLQKQNPNSGVFLFENHIFPVTVSTPVFNISSWNSVPGVNILQHIYREPDRPNFFNARKIILNPRMVIQTSVHSVLKPTGMNLRVPRATAIVFHCRGPLQASLPKQSLIRDSNIWRYSSLLIKNVNYVLQKTMFSHESLSP